MNTKQLRILAVVLPFLFGIALTAIRWGVFRNQLSWPVEIVSLALIAGGAYLFSTWIFRVVESREVEIRRRTDQLSALNEASLVLTMELDLNTVLNRVVNLACHLVGARYGALGVLGEDGRTIIQFITSGLSDQERQQMGPLPTGKGLLGSVIHGRRTIRLDDLTEDSRTIGFPPGHPTMHSFLGVPIQSKGHVIGNLYLTDKQPRGSSDASGYESFTSEDEQIVEMFATQAAIAIENAQLYRKTQQLAVLEERERFGMDLHDGIIQSIYAIGLMLEDTQHRLQAEPSIIEERIKRTLAGLNNVIRDIRNYILDLRPQRFQGKNLHDGIVELVRELQANTLMNVTFDADGYDTELLSNENSVEILHIIQEALTNVRKHARASNVAIELQFDQRDCRVRILDDGVGFDVNSPASARGNGLRNMRERTSVMKGSIEFVRPETRGTEIRLTVPVGR